jgi:hypothetical protein
MVPINSSEDLKPFLGHFVCFTTHSEHILSHKEYKNENSAMYAKLLETTLTGNTGNSFVVDKLLNLENNQKNSITFIIDYRIKEYALGMRLLTLKDIITIRKAILNKKANFIRCKSKSITNEQLPIDHELLKLGNLTNNEKRKYLNYSLESLHVLRLGYNRRGSMLARLPKDMLNYISDLVIDVEITDEKNQTLILPIIK